MERIRRNRSFQEYNPVICQTAAKLYHADQTEESETVKLLFRALRMISFEGWDVAGLIPVMLELGKAGRI